MNIVIDWWSSLKHGGLLIAPDKIASDFAAEPTPLPGWRAERLRRAVTAFDGSNDALSALLDFVLHDLSELPDAEWQKAQAVDSRWSLRSFTGALVKPRRLWQGPQGEVLPVFVPEDGASRQFSGRLGVGRSRQLLSRVVEWLRQKQQPLALVTNGRQWRLVHAGQDYDAWCEWDIDLWFVEGAPGPQVAAWRQLISREALVASDGQRQGPLLSAILASRKGQADLSAVLGERVRQAVEELITASHSAIEQAQQAGTAPAYADLYVAGSRIVMRCIITLFAEARNLLPVDNPVYQRAYSLEGLRQNLDRRATGRGNDRLSQSRSAWPRLMALFRLIHEGSSHEALPVPHYSGALFAPGNAASMDGIERALALLEGPQNAVTDRQVQRMLRLLTRTKVRVRQGRSNKLVDAPVDFSALSSEYIGILYEGLLDFELKQAAANDPVIFLAVGNEPALTLSQLEEMSDAVIKQLFDALKKKDKGGGDGDEDSGGDDDTAAEVEEDTEPETQAEDIEDTPAAEDEPEADAADADELALSQDHLQRAQAWLEKAAVIAGLVKRPRGRRATGASLGEDAEALAKAARSLCARLVAPGQFYLVRWGGTRKGAGTFYTRPQLAAPTVRRTLQPLAYEAVRTEVDPRTGLTEVVEWQPKRPEDILTLKVCDPAMGSGSFLAGALRYLTDALVASLYHHKLIERADDGGVPRMADGQISEVLSDELLKLRPTEEGFEDALRAQLKRHIVERCLYGVDLDPLAVELGRMALWVETMDRDLPFGFLDHKLKVGNALVGAWFDTYRDYPALAWDREGGDKDYQKDKPQNLVNHFYTDAKGKKRGDKFTAAIAARAKAVPEQLIGQLSGQMPLGGGLEASEVHDELLKVFKKLHRLPVHDSDRRAAVYRDEVLANPHYHALKARMDLWCALWFWPGEQIELAPLPLQFNQPDEAALAVATELAAKRRFFHWELEFPDVFSASQQGFDAMLGNPPWEIQKPSSKEFFSNHDPLYRAYGKQEALAQQIEYFKASPQLEHNWVAYVAGIKAMSNWVKCVGQPFGDRITTDKDGKKKHDLNLGGRGRDSFAMSQRLHDKWRAQRKKHKGFADSGHPFLHQGSADLNTFKMFLEQSHALMRPYGRMGMIVPSGLYTDKGTVSLRKLFIQGCNWEWLFGFENRDGVFDIHKSFKFCVSIVEKKSSTEAIRGSFMHRDVDEWSQPTRFLAFRKGAIFDLSPKSISLVEAQCELDLSILEKIYLSVGSFGDPEQFRREIDFSAPPAGMVRVDRSAWFSGLTETTRAIGPDGEVYLPVWQGSMISQHDGLASIYVRGAGNRTVWQLQDQRARTLRPQYLIHAKSYVSERGEARLVIRRITNPTNSRTLIAAIIPNAPSSDMLPVLATFSDKVEENVWKCCVLNSFAFDWVTRLKFSGSTGAGAIDPYFLADLPGIPKVDFPTLSLLAARLCLNSEMYSAVWLMLAARYPEIRSVDPTAPLASIEKLRLRCIIDAIVAYQFGLSEDDLKWILRDCDHPREVICSSKFSRTLDQKGFWRIDKDVDPELRHTVLTIVAFSELRRVGLEEFLSRHCGRGWQIPEFVCLKDFGLGRDSRALAGQPTASRLVDESQNGQIGDEEAEVAWKRIAALAQNSRQPECGEFISAKLIRNSAPLNEERNLPDDQGTLF